MSANESQATFSEFKADARILIVLMGSVGDVVRGLAVPTALKRKFPHCRITWLVEPRCAELVTAHAAIDRVIVFERDRGAKGVLKLWRELKQERFDLTLDLQRHFKSGLFSWLSAAPRRVGFHPLNSKEFNWLFNTEFIKFYSPKLNKLDHYLHFTELLGAASSAPAFELSVDRSCVEKLPPNYVVLVLGSNWETKDWFAPGFLQLGRMLLSETDLGIVLVGDSRKLESAAQMQSNLSSERVQNHVGKTTLRQLTSIIAQAKSCVGPDSGPAHIAAALRVPYVTLFGATDPDRVAAFGMSDLVVRSEIGCSPCERKICPGLDRLCMRLISPQAVWDKLRPTL